MAKAAEAAEAGIHNYLADPMKNISIALDFGKLEPLFLGANSFAQDFVGADDEQALPKFQKSFGIWSQRGGHRLATDRVKFKEDVMFWSVILDDPNRQGARLEVNENVDMEANKATEPSQSPIIKVKESLLPKGYEAWAISRSRGMKFRLEPGQEMRLSGFVRDTLAIYIGPAAKLKAISELSQAVSSVEALKFAWQKNASGIFLRLSLPWNADLQVEIRSTSGRILAYTRFGRLNPGNYNLPLPGGNGSQPAFVTIRLRSEKGSEDISQKILW